MTRLAVPILILLLMLFAGAVWLLVTYLDLPQFAGGPPATIPAEAVAPSAPSGEKPLAAAPTATAPSGDQKASFDVARIDPQGTSVFAGRAEPGSTVTVMGDGQALGTAEADENGEWTFATEHAFASAEPKLALTVKSAEETRAEKAAQTKVAGSLETREAAKEAPGPKSAGSVSAKLLKEFEGVVAAARTEAKEKAAEEAKATEKKEDAKIAEVEKSSEQAAAPLPAAPSTAAASAAAPPPAVAPSAASPPPAPPPAVALNETKPASVTPTRPSTSAPEAPVARKSIPVPITFIYNEANFTEDGKKAAALLLEYLELKRFPRVSLTGHADERGTPEFNMDLSRERLDAVASFLEAGGYKGELELVPKGETQPYAGVVRGQYPQEDLYQFDRRVELIIAP